MEELLKKISSYNLFNCLLPGIIFVFLLNEFTWFYIPDDNLLIFAFMCYFIGLIINRVGSIVVEPLAKKTKIVKFSPYKEFLEASKKDEKIEILSEQNNSFRTMIAMFLLFLVVKGYEWLIVKRPIIDSCTIYIVCSFGIIFFLSSYHKHTKFIVSRINKALEK